MSDRIPFGYTILDGKAVINPTEEKILLEFFDAFLAGKPLVQAGREAGLPMVKEAYAHLLFRKEYAGDGYYPEIIPEALQKQLMEEFQKRNVGKSNPRLKKKVRAVTAFHVLPFEEGFGKDVSAKEAAARIYEHIIPVRDSGKGAGV